MLIYQRVILAILGTIDEILEIGGISLRASLARRRSLPLEDAPAQGKKRASTLIKMVKMMIHQQVS